MRYTWRMQRSSPCFCDELVDQSSGQNAFRAPSQYVPGIGGRNAVPLFGQMPTPIRGKRFPADKRPFSLQLASDQIKRQFSVFQARGRFAFRFPLSRIPNQNGAAPIFIGGKNAFKIGTGKGGIVNRDGRAVFMRVQAWTIGDDPISESSFELEAQTKVHFAVEDIGILMNNERAAADGLPGRNCAPDAKSLGKVLAQVDDIHPVTCPSLFVALHLPKAVSKLCRSRHGDKTLF
jgi:hypothetical protein